MTRDTIDRSASGALGGLLDRLKAPSGLKAIAFVLGIAGSFVLLTTLLHMPHGPEHWSADLRTKYLSERPMTQHKRIALVYVTEKTLAPYAYLSPTDRKMLADLVRAVDAAGPAVIGFDFIIDRATETAKDEALFAALRNAKAKVVVGAIDEPRVGSRGKSFQETYLEKVNRPAGHLYFDVRRSKLVISDHVIRRTADPRDRHDYQKSFARQLVDAVGSYPEPESTYISWLLEPYDGSETFMAVPAEQVLGRGGPALPLADMFKGKIVMIGGNFSDRDQHLLPLSVLGDVRYPGLFVHAQIAAQLLDRRSLATLGLPLQLVVLILAAGLGFLIGRTQKQIHLVAELLSVIGLVLAGVAAFVYVDVILPYTGLLLTWLSGLAVGHYTKPRQA
jgi:CHASE2 domain-containing sensor protein